MVFCTGCGGAEIERKLYLTSKSSDGREVPQAQAARNPIVRHLPYQGVWLSARSFKKKKKNKRPPEVLIFLKVPSQELCQSKEKKGEGAPVQGDAG